MQLDIWCGWLNKAGIWLERNVADFLWHGVWTLFRETLNKMSTPRLGNLIMFCKDRLYYYSVVHENNFRLFRSQKRDFNNSL